MSDQLFLALRIDAGGTPATIRSNVTAAERSGFTFIVLADSPQPPGTGRGVNRIEAGTLAAFVATSTDRIGLAPTLHVTTTEPFHLATQLASLDHASHGRAAWLVGATNDPGDLATVGATPLAATELRREVTDVVDVARALWDSWQDDAVIRDIPTGRYLDPARIHHVDFTGARFTVKGPLITPRPPQGQVVVITAEQLAVADRSDIVLIDTSGHDDVAAIRARADRARQDGALLVFADVDVTGSPDDVITLLRALIGVVDGVLLGPPRPATATDPDRNPTLDADAGLAAHTGIAAEADIDAAAGTDADIAADADAEVRALLDPVLLALTADGLVRTPTAGDTLRTTLGLPRPANRFATATTS